MSVYSCDEPNQCVGIVCGSSSRLTHKAHATRATADKAGHTHTGRGRGVSSAGAERTLGGAHTQNSRRNSHTSPHMPTRREAPPRKHKMQPLGPVARILVSVVPIIRYCPD